MATPKKQWDAFISHASEDKVTVAVPLAELLAAKGLKIWIDKQQIKIGDSLREKIEHGLTQSRFGIVILSPAFLDKHWTTQELNGLSALEVDGDKVILPVWHNIRRQDLTQRASMLAGRLATRTSDGLDGVADQLAAEILDPKHGSPSSKAPSLARRLTNFLAQDPDSEQIFQFCKQNTAVIALAANRPGLHMLAFEEEDTRARGFVGWNPNNVEEGSTLVVFGPASPQIEEGSTEIPPDLMKCLESVVEIVGAIKGGHIKPTNGETIPNNLSQIRVFLGMRMTYFKDDIFIGRALSEYDVKIRSYDHLLLSLAWRYDG